MGDYNHERNKTHGLAQARPNYMRVYSVRLAQARPNYTCV
jgi:hypothetical protein